MQDYPPLATSAAAHDAADEAAENQEPGNDASCYDEAARGFGKIVPPVVIRRAAVASSAPVGGTLPIVAAGLASTAVVVGRPVVAVGVKNPQHI